MPYAKYKTTKSFKKQENSWKKELKRVQKKTEKFFKLASKPLEKSDLKKITSKMDDSSNSNSDSSVDQ